MENEKVSICCNTSVYVAGHTTHYYVCEACEMPCDVKENQEPYFNQKASA